MRVAKEFRVSLSCGYTRRPVGLTDRCMKEMRMFYRKCSPHLINVLSLCWQYVYECEYHSTYTIEFVIGCWIFLSVVVFDINVYHARLFCLWNSDTYLLEVLWIAFAIPCTWRSAKIYRYLSLYPKPLFRQDVVGLYQVSAKVSRTLCVQPVSHLLLSR